MDTDAPVPPVELTPEELRFLRAIKGGATVEKAAKRARRSRRWAYYTLNRLRRRTLTPARVH